MKLRSFKPLQIAAFRMRRHHLTARVADLLIAVRDVGGIQAQVAGWARLAVGVRTIGITPVAIEEALLRDHSLIKTYAMRGTLHWITSEDLPAVLGVVLDSQIYRRLRRIRIQYGRMNDGEAEAMMKDLESMLGEGPVERSVLKRQLRAAATRHVRVWLDDSWGSIFQMAAMEGRICFGPDRGREATLVRLDHWMPSFERLPFEEAAGVLLRRYLKVYGPATRRDFARWASLSAAQARSAWEKLAGEIVEVDAAGTQAWILKNDADELARSRLRSSVVRLLPGFDPYLLGHAGKDHMVESKYYKRIFRNQGWISPVVLCDGVIIGTWSHEVKKDRLTVSVTPFGKISARVKTGMEAETARMGRFLGNSTELVIDRR